MSNSPKIPRVTGQQCGPFPELRLTKGVKNAANDELTTSVESCERAALCGVVVVIAGLVTEVVLAIHQTFTPISWDSFEGTWGAVIADLLVALGVSAEVIFSKLGASRQRELQSRTDAKLTEALNRAARAEEQLAPRNLTKAQFDELQTLRGKVSTVFITTPSDFEATRYAAEIGVALLHAGIKVFNAPQRIGLIWTELYIVIPEPVPAYSDVPLYAAFSKAGFSVGCGPRTAAPMGDLPKDVPVIMVGVKKPLNGDIPPFMASLGTPAPST